MTTRTDAFASALTMLWSTSSVPANGSVRSRTPGALACACQVKGWDAPPWMSTVSGGGCSVAGGPETIAGPALTASADIPPGFETVTVTVTSSPTRTRAGALAVAASEAGWAASTWKTPSMEPRPYGPSSDRPYMPGARAPGTVAEMVCVSTQRTSRSSTAPRNARKPASTSIRLPLPSCCATEGVNPSPWSSTGVSRPA